MSLWCAAQWRAVALAIAAVPSLAGAHTRDEAGVRQVENERREAWLRHDTATLDRIWAPEYVQTTDTGAQTTKAAQLESARRMTGIDSFLIDDIKVMLYGDFAVLTSHEVFQGVAFPGGRDFRTTRAFVYRDGRWQMVASHFSAMPKPGSK